MRLQSSIFRTSPHSVSVELFLLTQVGNIWASWLSAEVFAVIYCTAYITDGGRLVSAEAYVVLEKIVEVNYIGKKSSVSVHCCHFCTISCLLYFSLSKCLITSYVFKNLIEFDLFIFKPPLSVLSSFSQFFFFQNGWPSLPKEKVRPLFSDLPAPLKMPILSLTNTV